MSKSTATLPGLLRRLAALTYDSAALFSVLFVASAMVVIPVQMLWDITDISDRPLFQAYLALIIFNFFGWFWTHGGQTLGLRAWHMRLVRIDGKPLTWVDVLKRFIAALILWLPFHIGLQLTGLEATRAALIALLPFGLGFLWILFDHRKLAWHDRLSGTHPILAKK